MNRVDTLAHSIMVHDEQEKSKRIATKDLSAVQQAELRETELKLGMVHNPDQVHNFSGTAMHVQGVNRPTLLTV